MADLPTEEGTVELPKLPEPDYPELWDGENEFWARRLFTAYSMEMFARAAVLADRASRSPVVGAVGGEPLSDFFCPACFAEVTHAQADEVTRDARRYRWLRDVGDATWRPFGIRTGYSAKQADAAIDAAMGGIGVSPTGSPEGEVSNG